MSSAAPEPPAHRELLLKARERLAAANIDDPDDEAELLLRLALRESAGEPAASRSRLFSQLPDAAEPAVVSRLDCLLARRLAHEPTAYIAGTREFLGLDFVVTPDVLIPRPETELLVETALEVLHASPMATPIAVDVGTGSGAIAVALAVALPRAVIHATDVSRLALAVALTNARRHGVGRRISFHQGDLLLPLERRVDVIAANLPYVTTEDWSRLPPELRDYEPRLALDGGHDGLSLVRRLLKQAPRYLRPGGAVCLEFGPAQAKPIAGLAQSLMPRAALTQLRDLGGLERAMLIELPA